MKAFVSWSGGKDCMLAAHRFVNQNGNEITCLLNMIDNDNKHSRSHGIKKELIKAQANCLSIDIVQKSTNFKSYETNFKEAIESLKTKGVTAGVFGDIYLEAHRVWIERVCSDMNIKAVFPLWGENTTELLNEFISLGYKTLIVAINKSKLSAKWLGRTIDFNFMNEILKLENIDPCAENGEYHSFVYDGPLFNKALLINKESIIEDDKHIFQSISLKSNKQL